MTMSGLISYSPVSLSSSLHPRHAERWRRYWPSAGTGLLIASSAAATLSVDHHGAGGCRLMIASPRRPRCIMAAAAVRSLQYPLVSEDEQSHEPKFFEVELQVRDYELNQFGVVNNAAYASYSQHALHEIGRCAGLNDYDVVRKGESLAISNVYIKYIAPLTSGDRFVVRVRATNITAARMFFDCFIFKLPYHEPIVQTKSTAVWIGPNQRPVRIPPDFAANLLRLSSSTTEGSSVNGELAIPEEMGILVSCAV